MLLFWQNFHWGTVVGCSNKIKQWLIFNWNPTSPLGDRWFRACVPVSIPPTPTSNAFVLYQSLQLLHPILCTVLEEGFSPPPPSSPGLWTVVSIGVVATYIRLFRHPGHHHFFIIFSTPFYIDFYSILNPNLEQKSIRNRSKIDKNEGRGKPWNSSPKSIDFWSLSVGAEPRNTLAG